MATKDLFNRVKVAALFAPKAAVADDTAIVSSIVDTLGYESVLIALVTGTNADADAVNSLKIEHGDVSNLSDATTVTAADLQIDTTLDATPGAGNSAAYDFSDDGVAFKIGYKGSKRYIRVTETSGVGGVGANTGTIFLGGVVVLSNARHQPAGATQTP